VRFPYKRSLGPVTGQFMTALAGRRLIGIRSGDRVVIPFPVLPHQIRRRQLLGGLINEYRPAA
jgi:hypothetical protein